MTKFAFRPLRPLKFATAVLPLALVGCGYQKPEVTTGSVLERKESAQPIVRALNPTQIAALNEWAAKQGRTWSREWFGEYASYISPIEISVQFQDGTTARAQVGFNSIALVGKAGYYRRLLSPQELGLLTLALNAK